MVEQLTLTAAAAAQCFGWSRERQYQVGTAQDGAGRMVEKRTDSVLLLVVPGQQLPGQAFVISLFVGVRHQGQHLNTIVTIPPSYMCVLVQPLHRGILLWWHALFPLYNDNYLFELLRSVQVSPAVRSVGGAWGSTHLLVGRQSTTTKYPITSRTSRVAVQRLPLRTNATVL